ncbi:FAD-dependent monooxygenase [Sphingobium algorifonticola]|uniref:FAD-binding domain-containing protein n=1 Tax=Sphingobium algorifonticola TaxID=2008318 RepID=A0A437J9Y8_9SPHN|nr:FAD-dependent monooxygenase [Sphingobium algorifonticola]RVT42329.1 hypothetical protein ENE74_09050 [Sphingobium algorifonticola]
MTLPPEVEVLIAGSGPTGLACANLLGLYGVRTLLIERNADVSSIPKGILIDDEFHRQFAMVGVAPLLEKHFVQGVGVTFYGVGGAPLVEVKGFVTPNGFPNRSAIHQPTLEADLRDHARTWPDVTLAYGHGLTGVEQDADGVTATIARPDGSVAMVRAAYIIGADGAGSTVRAAAGIPFEGGSINQPHVVIDVADDPDQVRFSRFFCHPSRPRNSVPAPYGGRRYEFMLLPGEDPQTMARDDRLADLIAMIRPDGQVEIIRKAVYYFHQKLVTRMASGRIFLAGDSAHQMPPFGAQGMNSGGKDAVNLCWKLAMVLRGQAGPSLLETYHVERHSHARAMIRLSVMIGRLANIRSRPLALLRDILFQLANRFPAARAWFGRQGYLPRQRYVDGFVIDPPRSRNDDSFVGRMLPCPNFGAAGTLDLWLGTGFALVAVDAPQVHASHPLWRRLNAACIAFGAAPSGFKAVDPTDHHFDAVWRRHRGEVLVVRPDRYVLTAVPPAQLDNAARRIEVMLGHMTKQSAT